MAIAQEYLGMCYKLAQEQGAIVQIDGDRITLIPQKVEKASEKKHASRKLPKVLEEGQITLLLAQFEREYPTGSGKRNVTNYRNRVMVETMLRAGLRVSEVSNLTPADVNLVKGSIYIQLGKGQKDRHVVIGQHLMDLLSKWNELRLKSSPYFFCTCNGTRVAPRHLNFVLHRLSEQSGVFIQDGLKKRPAHNHVFRHCYASSLLSNNVNIREVQELLGHAKLSTTERYTHINMTELDKKIKALG